jgi:hypothetical protein
VTPLERLALRVSAQVYERLPFEYRVMLLDYVEALKRETRLEALREALSVMTRLSPYTGSYPTLMERVLRGMIDKETADGP